MTSTLGGSEQTLVSQFCPRILIRLAPHKGDALAAAIYDKFSDIVAGSKIL